VHFSAVSLFSGCGGSDLGLKSAGIETIWANEINSNACELYEALVCKDTIENCDVQDIDIFPKADILVGCYPCTGFSQAGRRENSDGINFLYREFDRALRQIKPLAFIVENVNGMRFSQNSHLLKNQLVRFRSAGYRVSWEILDAKDFGLAQDRKRLLLVGVRSKEKIDYIFPTPTHGPSGRQPYRTLRDTIWHLRNAPDGSFDDEPLHWYYLSRSRTWSQQSPCIVAHWRHVGLHPDSPPLRKVKTDHWEFTRPGSARRFSYLECAALQGFTNIKAIKNLKSVSVKNKFTAIGNAVPAPLFGSVAKSLVRQLRKS